jgi:hypothetical protein
VAISARLLVGVNRHWKLLHVVFLITTYRLPEQAARLANLLASVTGATVLIHHDAAATDESYRVLRRGVEGHANIVFLHRRNFKYATFDHVQVTLDGMRYVVDANLDFTHFVVLTGQCYPIKPVVRMRRWFDERAAASIAGATAFPHPTWPDGGYNRVNVRVYQYRADSLPGFVRRALPQRAGWIALPKPSLIRHRLGGRAETTIPRDVGELYGGSSYIAVARAHVRFVLENAQPYEKFFRRSYIPDELFFQTMLMNSPFANEVVDEPLHLVDFTTLGGMHPRVMTSEDLELMAESPALFVRKVDSSVDPRVLDRIDRELLELAP